ncbi:hypothetical protein ACFQ34_14110 [Pseudonocardia benzenivorans]|uniref:Uncharacterized protein n=2 Tax=Pseudonocardia TaxID=1847 RepID=F4CYR3_PSEUX|nr:hypothetical protein [Pseudonocardia dioxanivorans]AEA26633.1 hypothetical protein Psed_4478 [Pseudonocardia dioxanivorans CB1190]GJF05744.1 hypothetical protein PSD17_46940 [Pseudonocardia sp. D17]
MADTNGTTGATDTEEAPASVRRMDTPESAELTKMAAVFEDLQYVLQCCEHLVSTLANNPEPVVVEALWTGALVAYVRCFSGRTEVLKDADLAELKMDGQVGEFHGLIKKLRDHYASRHTNPRETFTVGVAQNNAGAPTGVAVVSATQPIVDDTAVRQLGRIAYGLSGLLDARMQEAQQKVLAAASAMNPAQLSSLPLVHIDA